MRKNMIPYLFILISFCASISDAALYPHCQYEHSSFAPSVQEIHCSPRLQSYLDTILQIPEMQHIFSRIQQEGPISIRENTNHSFAFEAYWDGDARAVIVSMQQPRSAGSIYASILFELQNALTNRQITALFHRACRGELSRSQFIEQLERLEHQNALQTVVLLRKGVRARILPPDATDWDVYTRFDDHFRVQQRSGHSQFIGHLYDQMHGYRA